MGGMAVKEAGAPPTTISPGEQEISLTVSIAFSIE